MSIFPLRLPRPAAVALAGLAATLAAPAGAYLYWANPSLAGGAAAGNEPGMTVPLANATPKEDQANLVWALRAGLNVAALQCQFQPALRTVDNYNNLLHQHAAELQQTYATLSAYFKRTGGKTWQTALDQYTTRTYNSFSTLKAQLLFCDTAAAIGRETAEAPHGQLGAIATARMHALRASLVPAGDAAFAWTGEGLPVTAPDDLAPRCFDKKGREKPCSS